MRPVSSSVVPKRCRVTIVCAQSASAHSRPSPERRGFRGTLAAGRRCGDCLSGRPDVVHDKVWYAPELNQARTDGVQQLAGGGQARHRDKSRMAEYRAEMDNTHCIGALALDMDGREDVGTRAAQQAAAVSVVEKLPWQGFCLMELGARIQRWRLALGRSS